MQEIWDLYKSIQTPVWFYHIKGHLLSIGAKKYHELMHKDITGYTLYHKAMTDKEIQADKAEHAKNLSLENNSFALEDEQLQKFAAMNLVADAVANLCIETAEAKQWQSMLSSSVLTA